MRIVVSEGSQPAKVVAGARERLRKLWPWDTACAPNEAQPLRKMPPVLRVLLQHYTHKNIEIQIDTSNGKVRHCCRCQT